MPRKPIQTNTGPIDTGNNPDNSPPIPDAPGVTGRNYAPSGMHGGMSREPAQYNPEHTPDSAVDQWRNRRKMAWICLAAFMIVTAYALVWMPPDRIKAAEVVITWFFMGVTSIVGAYFGFATWSQIKGK